MTSDAEVVLPVGYDELLADLKKRVAGARWRAQRVVNTELLGLYWQLGHVVLTRQRAEGWGTRVLDRLAADLRSAFPAMRGLSRSNLFYMRALAAAWPESAIVQQPVGQLPWGHVTVLLDKLADPDERDWYAAAAVEWGWTRAVLAQQIAGRLRTRSGAAPSNFTARLPAADSELAQQLTRDPYVLDFLDLTGPVAERDLEDALVARVQTFLLELGHGFAFLGRQYRFEVDGEEFRIDLLFFNWRQSRFVVVELKADRFRPEFTGQLGFYVAWVDEQLRDRSQHAATVGILLCAGRNDSVVRYSLAGSAVPLAVADYTYDALPAAVREVVPTAGALLAAVSSDPDSGGFDTATPAEVPGPRTAAGALSVPAAARPAPVSSDEATGPGIAVVVAGLREVLGAELVAYLGGVRETRVARQWADGVRGVQDPADERRLRLAHQVAGLLMVREPAGVVAAWFQGLNPELGDRSPARVLREDDPDLAGPLVLAAARSFAATG